MTVALHEDEVRAIPVANSIAGTPAPLKNEARARGGTNPSARPSALPKNEALAERQSNASVHTPAPLKDDPRPRMDTNSGALAVAGQNTPLGGEAVARSEFMGDAPRLPGDPFIVLRVWTAMHEDAQKARIAASNRVGAGNVDPLIYADTLAHLEYAEHMLLLARRRAFRRLAKQHLPNVYAWQQSALGIGEDTLARLIGNLGHPYIATPHRWEGEGKNRVLVVGEPFERNVAKLWAYCGFGDPTRKRRAGMSQDDAFALGNTRCKTSVYLMAEACMKNIRSPYRRVYDAARVEYATREGWSAGRQHAAAMRMVAKEILRDLWIAAREDACSTTR